MSTEHDLALLEREFEALRERAWYANNGPLLVTFERRIAARFGTGIDAVALCTAEAVVQLLVFDQRWRGGDVVVAPTLAPTIAAAARFGALGEALGADGGVTGRLVLLDTEAALRSERPPEERWMVDGTAQFPGNTALLCELLARGASVLLCLRRGAGWTAGEGGVLVTRDTSVRDFLRTARNHHTQHTLAPTPLRFNYKVSEAVALIALHDLGASMPDGTGMPCPDVP